MTSKTAREAAKRDEEGMDGLLLKQPRSPHRGIPLDPNHLGFILFEAYPAEAVRAVLADWGPGSFLELNSQKVTAGNELLTMDKNSATTFDSSSAMSG